MKWAIREAVDVYFKAKSTLKLGARTIRAGEPVLIFDTVQTSTLEVAAEIAYVTGGRGNSRILSFEGDKTLTFNFEEALLSNEGLAILSGADLIPARNSRLPGSSPNARAVVAHYTEKYAVVTNNRRDLDQTNQYPDDPSLVNPDAATGDHSPRGGNLNVWLTRKPFVGQNSSIYVMLLDHAGEMSGSPVEVNLYNDSIAPRETSTLAQRDAEYMRWPATGGTAPRTRPAGATSSARDTAATAAQRDAATADAIARINRQVHLSKFNPGDSFIAVDRLGNPMRVIGAAEVATRSDGTGADAVPWLVGSDTPVFPHPQNPAAAGVFDDQVAHYVDAASMARNWASAWGDIRAYIRVVGAANFGTQWGQLAPSVMQTPAVGDDLGFRNPTIQEPTEVEFALEMQGTRPAVPPATGNVRIGSYAYLLAPSGGIAQPKAHKEGTVYVYKVNIPSILFQDIVLCDYYVEYRRNATQVSILPDKFGPFLYVEGSSLVRRASDGMDLPAEFVIPKFKITTALTFTMAATGDPSTFNFQGDAYPDFSKFDLTRRVLADIQILDADDNFDQGFQGAPADPTDYRRFHYTDNDGEYLWKDPSMQPHGNLDFADTGTYVPDEGGPATRTPGLGVISTNERFHTLANGNPDYVTGENLPNRPIGQHYIVDTNNPDQTGGNRT